MLVLDFEFGDAYTPPLTSAVNFKFPYVVLVVPAYRNVYRHRYERARTADSQTKLLHGEARAITKSTVLPWNVATPISSDYRIKYKLQMTVLDGSTVLRYDSFEEFNSDNLLPLVHHLEEIDRSITLRYDSFEELESSYQFSYVVPKTEDKQFALEYSHVNLTGEARVYSTIIPPLDTSKVDFNFGYEPQHAEGSKAALFFDFGIDPNTIPVVGNEPVNVYVNGVIQPTDRHFGLITGGKSDTQDVQTLLPYDGIAEFIIGSGFEIRSKKDPDVNDPDPNIPIEAIVHIPYEVLTIMNNVNITDVLTNTVLDFTDFTMSRDIDSFVWSFNFTIKSEASLTLVKPVGRVLKSVIVNINGLLIRAFVGKTSKSQSVNKGNGKVTVVHKCSAWSELRKLGDPYSRKRSATIDILTGSNQLVTTELLGSGHTVEWETTIWNVPAGVHSYQNKTPIGAILSVVNAIGAVIVPNLNNFTFKVRPRFPISPWDWDTTESIDREMSESQFFSIDNEAVPKENPDSVYVFGNDAGAHCVRFGKAGSSPLPDVVNKYLATSLACQERGRNEVAKNCYLEPIPMTTYVDNNGLIMPQELIEFTEQDGVTKWRGFVLGTTITCNRIGTAIIQKINVVRFHEDD